MTVEDLLNKPSIEQRFMLIEDSIAYEWNINNRRKLSNIRDLILIKCYSLISGRNEKIKRFLRVFGVTFLGVGIILSLIEFLFYSFMNNITEFYLPVVALHMCAIFGILFLSYKQLKPLFVKYEDERNERIVLDMFKKHLKLSRVH